MTLLQGSGTIHEITRITLTHLNCSSDSCDLGFVFVRVNSWIVPLPCGKASYILVGFFSDSLL